MNERVAAWLALATERLGDGEVPLYLILGVGHRAAARREPAPDGVGGDVLRGPVGSTAVRRLIETRRPVLSIHGHIHESGGERRIGETLCINPGSEANHGVLRGYLVDVGRKGIELVQRVEG